LAGVDPGGAVRDPGFDLVLRRLGRLDYFDLWRGEAVRPHDGDEGFVIRKCKDEGGEKVLSLKLPRDAGD
jgi:hypothetical protein